LSLEFLSKFSGKEKNIFYIAVVFLSLALSDRLILGPMMDQIQVKEAEIQKQKSVIAMDARILAYKDKILKDKEALKKYFSTVQKDDDVVNNEFFSLIEKLATDSQITLVKGNPASSRKQDNYIEYFASLDCTGELKNVITFMHMINSSEGLLKIVKFNMTPKRGTSSEVNVSMTVVNVFVPPDSVDVAKVSP
jgi:Tfp pilus assembly protein PilO